MEPILTLDSIHTYIGQFHILEGVSISGPSRQYNRTVRAKWRWKKRQLSNPSLVSHLPAMEKSFLTEMEVQGETSL